ncbi:hypothetical protein QBC41DRAFT_58708 [Cercophora samala]|uniref:Uncharacterized protein n=1 Tax=Cercophora samala TaxID=330535 RepID=A0AA40DC85_9PEZI|nr:hypothetical protein QBC41DRAFT_58708 [Cercophora samala]
MQKWCLRQRNRTGGGSFLPWPAQLPNSPRLSCSRPRLCCLGSEVFEICHHHDHVWSPSTADTTMTTARSMDLPPQRKKGTSGKPTGQTLGSWLLSPVCSVPVFDVALDDTVAHAATVGSRAPGPPSSASLGGQSSWQSWGVCDRSLPPRGRYGYLGWANPALRKTAFCRIPHRRRVCHHRRWRVVIRAFFPVVNHQNLAIGHVTDRPSTSGNGPIKASR